MHLKLETETLQQMRVVQSILTIKLPISTILMNQSD